MSTISPLIDTLLHHVLGRRGELERHASPPRGPMVVSEAREVQEQLREEPGKQKVASPGAVSQGVKGASAPGGRQARVDGDAGGQPDSPQGESENLSRQARIIAQVLGRFPQPASVMRLPELSSTQAGALPSARFSAAAEWTGGVEGAELRPPMRLSAGAIASALRDGVIESGLFYERHLAQALIDKWPLARLAHEPQARVATKAGAGLEEDIAPLVRQQLELLSGEPLRLQLPLQGGVVGLTILLDDQEGQDDAPGGEAAPGEGRSPDRPRWRTVVSVELPALGRVDASIGGYQDGVRVELRGASEEARAVLASGEKALEAGLDGHGLALSALSVKALDAKTKGAAP